MPFWLTHPLHGRMPVYNRGDVERNALAGWTLLNEGESPTPVGNSRSTEVFEKYPLPSDSAADGEIGSSRAIAPQPDSFCMPISAAEKRKPGRPPPKAK